MKLVQAFLIAVSTFGVGIVSARLVTVDNLCPFTIWPAVFTGAGELPPEAPTGWEAAPGSTFSIVVPDNWHDARIWGRRDCNFSIPGPGSCLDGGCNGGLECDPTTGTGVPPATLAQFSLTTLLTENDFYSISIVDGFNLPMSLTNNQGCPVASCPVDLIPNCPAELAGPFNSTGSAVGCKSACDANLDGDQADSPNCCSGSFSTPATCPSSGVEYYSYFKDNCPNAGVYAFDASNVTWTCPSIVGADYWVTFCPEA